MPRVAMERWLLNGVLNEHGDCRRAPPPGEKKGKKKKKNRSPNGAGDEALAVEAGVKAYCLAGWVRRYADPSSPLSGLI